MPSEILRNFDIIPFQDNLLEWYEENKRDLPWRRTDDPYKIWVSEIMLQQTQVDTVIPYFYRFIEQFPTVYDLASAKEEEVLKAWEGLGYYSRARNLQHAVREVVSEYDGQVPDNPAELGKLKGVGPYTRGAILSIAFHQAEPAVDGNVMRVFSRVFNIKDDISLGRTRKKFETLTKDLIPEHDPSSFNQAVMELGALVCTPRTPMCMLCPVNEYCEAFNEGVQEQLPVKAKKAKQKKEFYLAVLIKDQRGHIIVEQRPGTGLLANLWQFPMIPEKFKEPEQAEQWLYKEYGLEVTLKKKRGKLKHVFTHIIWELEIHDAVLLNTEVNDERLRLIDVDDVTQYPFPVSHQKMMTYL